MHQIISTLLQRLNMAGRIEHSAPTIGLTVPREFALSELQGLFDRKGWGCLSEAEFNEALAVCNIQPFHTISVGARETRRIRSKAHRQRSLCTAS